jgi:hypothetical protein
MIDAVRGALQRMGSRAEAVDTCPVCGRPVVPGDDRVRAWRGKQAHRNCAHYSGRSRRRSQRVHNRFTRS